MGAIGGKLVDNNDGSLQKYAEKAYVEGKDAIFRRTAMAVFRALGTKSPEAAVDKNMTSAEIVRALKGYIPKFGEKANYGKKFADDANAQKKVYDAIINAIKENYPSMVIHTNLPLGEQLQEAMEFLTTMGTNVQSEFISVATDLNRVSRNLQTLKDVIAELYGKLKNEVKKSNPELADTYNNLYNAFDTEFKRQSDLLQNLIGKTIEPSKSELISALSENPDFKGLVASLDQKFGTDSLGSSLAILVSRAGGVAYSANLVKNALETLKMTVADLAKAKSPSELQQKTLGVLMDPKSKVDMDKFLKAIEVLFNNDYQKDAIIAELQKSSKSGGEDPPSVLSTSSDASQSGSDNDSDDSENLIDIDKIGGADDDEDSKNLPAYFRGKSLIKRIDDKKKQRDIVFRQFKQLLREKYENIVRIADGLSKFVGNEIPRSLELKKFIDLFGTLTPLTRENLHLALTGYFQDFTSQNKRHDFLNKYALVAEVIMPLVNGPHGKAFEMLKAALLEMVDTVETFTKSMIKSLTDIKVLTPEQLVERAHSIADRVYTGSGHKQFVNWISFTKIQKDMLYFYDMATLKENFRMRGADYDIYAKDYKNVIGEEAGSMINRIKREFKVLIERSDPALPAPAAATNAFEEIADVIRLKCDTLANAEQKQACYKKYIHILERMLRAKVDLIEVAQAVELYLVSFTKGIMHDPDVIKNLDDALQGVTIVSKYFTDHSGNALATLFEAVAERKNPLDKAKEGKVYFDAAHPHGDIVADIGDILTGIDVSDANLTKSQVEKFLNLSHHTIKNIRMLDNIMSCFGSVAEGLTKTNPAQDTFMNPAQMLNKLVNYINMSAFCLVRDGASKLSLQEVRTIESKSDLYDAPDSKTMANLQGINKGVSLFTDTHELFMMVIKSVVSKIFVSIDLYRLMNRPVSTKNMYNNLSASRMILGGDEHVTVIPELFEVYLRIPLLAEFYRDLFGFDAHNVAGSGDEWLLAVLPNIEGVWSRLFAVVFDEARQIKNGAYPQNIARKIVAAINDVHKHMKAANSKITNIDVINHFILEVNRAMGFIQRKQVVAFIDERRRNLTDQNYANNLDQDEFDILDADNQFKPGPAPSDNFVDVSLNSRKVTNIVSLKLGKLLRQQHQMINKKYVQTLSGAHALPSFNEHIASMKARFAQSISEEEKLNVVTSLIGGLDIETNVSDLYKNIMVHELVVNPVQLLTSVATMLVDFNSIFVHIHNAVPGVGAQYTLPVSVATPYAGSLFLNAIYNEFETRYNEYEGRTGYDSVWFEFFLDYVLQFYATRPQLVGVEIGTNGVFNFDFSRVKELFETEIARIEENAKTLKLVCSKDLIDSIDTFLMEKLTPIKNDFVQLILNDRDNYGLNSSVSVMLPEMLKYINNGNCADVFRRIIYYSYKPGSLPNCCTVAKLDVFPFNIISLKKPAETKEEKATISSLFGDIQNETVLDPKSSERNIEVLKNLQQVNKLLQAPVILFESSNTLNNWNVNREFKTEPLSDAKGVAVVRHDIYARGEYKSCPLARLKSLFFAFNKSMHMFIQSNLSHDTDPKIYPALLEQFVNGAAANEVIGQNGFPNVRALKYFKGVDRLGGNAPFMGDGDDAPKQVQDTVEKFLSAQGVNLFNCTKTRPDEEKIKNALAEAVALIQDLIDGKNNHAISANTAMAAAAVRSIENLRKDLARLMQKQLSAKDVIDIIKNIRENTEVKKSAIVERQLDEVCNMMASMFEGKRANDIFSVVFDQPQQPQQPPADAKAPPLPNAASAMPSASNLSPTENIRNMQARLHVASDTLTELTKRADAKAPQQPPPNAAPAAPPPPPLLNAEVVNEDKKNGGAPTAVYQYVARTDGKLLDVDIMSSKDKIPYGCIPESPDENSVLYMSTAMTIRSLMNSVTTNGKHRYLYESLAEIPSYLKTRMQTNLPLFRDIFKGIALKATFMRNIVNFTKTTSLALVMAETTIEYNVDDVLASKSKLKKMSRKPSDEVKQYFIALLTKIIDLCLAVERCIDVVYNELNPKIPHFMDTFQGQANMFKKENMRYPFAPVSFATHLTFGLNPLVLPSAEVDSNILHGLKAITHTDKFDISNFPYMADLYNAYSSGTKDRKIVPNEYINALKRVYDTSKMLRLVALTDRLTCAHHLNSMAMLVLDRQRLLNMNSNINPYTSGLEYLVGTPAKSTAPHGYSRDGLQVGNLLDINVSPLNMSAFIREVPFTNLINYSWSFDRFVDEFDGNAINDDAIDQSTVMPANVNIYTSRTFFVKFPYAGLAKPDTLVTILRTFFGMQDNKFGLPKINLQILYKVLLFQPEILLNEFKNSVAVAPHYIKHLMLKNFNMSAIPNKLLRQHIDYKSTTLIDSSSQTAHRFDTVLIRTLSWLGLIQMYLRAVVSTHLDWINGPVTSLNSITKRVTNIEDGEVHEKEDEFGSDYGNVFEEM